MAQAGEKKNRSVIIPKDVNTMQHRPTNSPTRALVIVFVQVKDTNQSLAFKRFRLTFFSDREKDKIQFLVIYRLIIQNMCLRGHNVIQTYNNNDNKDEIVFLYVTIFYSQLQEDGSRCSALLRHDQSVAPQRQELKKKKPKPDS